MSRWKLPKSDPLEDARRAMDRLRAAAVQPSEIVLALIAHPDDLDALERRYGPGSRFVSVVTSGRIELIPYRHARRGTGSALYADGRVRPVDLGTLH